MAASDFPQGPKVSETPLEVLDKHVMGPGLFHQYYHPVVWFLIGVGSAAGANYATRRPAWSGIQKHAFFGLALGYIGYYLDKRKDGKLAERDAIFRHYIQLHPEDFPPYERKKFKDVFESWVPIR